MTDINIRGSWHTVPDEVANELNRYALHVDALHDGIRNMRLKEQTAERHPTKPIRMAAWYAKMDLYKLLPRQAKQLELLK